jgi:hypothetical protein
MIANLENELNKIFNFHDTNILYNYSFNKYDNNFKINLFRKILESIKKSKKPLNYYYKIYDSIVDEINNIYLDENIDELVKNNFDYFIINSKILKHFSIISYGYQILEKLNNRYLFILCNDTTIINKYLLISAKYSNITTFFYWLKISHYKCIDNIPYILYKNIFCNSIVNFDDKLYKKIIEKTNTNNIIYLNNNSFIMNAIQTLSKSKLDYKNILNRIKILSNYINLSDYFNKIIYEFNCVNILLSIHKYCNKLSYSYKTLKHIINGIYTSDTNRNTTIFTKNINKLLNILNTERERMLVHIILLLYYDYIFDNFIYNKQIINKIICENYEDIILSILLKKFENFMKLLSYDLTKLLLSVIMKYNYMAIVLPNHINFLNISYLLFTRFLVYNDNCKPRIKKIILSANILLHNLRIYAKKIYNNKIIKHRHYFYELHNELLTYEPKKNIPILKYGSYNYKIKNQFRCLIKPINNSTNIIILPSNLFPETNIFKKYKSKGLYIDNINLYIILDIHLEDNLYEDRYKIIRKEYNKDLSCEIIEYNKLNDIIDINKKEQIIINQIANKQSSNELDKEYWYPILTIYINNKSLMEELYNYFKQNPEDIFIQIFTYA